MQKAPSASKSTFELYNWLIYSPNRALTHRHCKHPPRSYPSSSTSHSFFLYLSLSLSFAPKKSTEIDARKGIARYIRWTRVIIARVNASLAIYTCNNRPWEWSTACAREVRLISRKRAIGCKSPIEVSACAHMRRISRERAIFALRADVKYARAGEIMVNWKFNSSDEVVKSNLN